MPLMIFLGKTARQVRESRKLTQREAAELLGISVVHLSNIENNKAAPSQSLIDKYRELWGVDLYVMAWCLHGDTMKLPAAIRKPAEALAKAWNAQLKGMAKQTEIDSSCSESDK